MRNGCTESSPIEAKITKEDLKRRLKKEVADFYKRDDRQWKVPIVDLLRDLKETDTRAVFFGGTPRSLLTSRVFEKRFGRPRDVDIVVSGVSIEFLKERFASLIARENRFGGLQLRSKDWEFDIWPLARTWAFVNDSVECPSFAELPRTTFFNLEAVAVEIWPKPGQARRLYSGDDQFFDGILNRTLEVNREDNPFPELCVVRALVIGSSLNFKLGPRLSAYVANSGSHLSPSDLEAIQAKHYGEVRCTGRTLRGWIDYVSEQNIRDPDAPTALPRKGQQDFWPIQTNAESIQCRVLALNATPHL